MTHSEIVELLTKAAKASGFNETDTSISATADIILSSAQSLSATGIITKDDACHALLKVLNLCAPLHDVTQHICDDCKEIKDTVSDTQFNVASVAGDDEASALVYRFKLCDECFYKRCQRQSLK